MIYGKLSTVEQKTVHLMINRFKTPDMVECMRRFSGSGNGIKTPEMNIDDQTNKSAEKKVIEDLSKEPIRKPFLACRRYMDLVGKVALITGGTKGIGLAVAKNLIQNGASRVIVSGRNAFDGDEAHKILMDKCDSLDGDQKVQYVQMDVNCDDGLKRLFKTVDCMGNLDILVNSAGILNESRSWTEMIETNVKALITSTELGIDLMKNSKTPGGVILNLSSVYAIRPMAQLPLFSATKAAVRNATLGFSKMGDSSLRILTACLGPTDTSLLMNLSPGEIAGQWTTEERENLLESLKTKQNVDCAGRSLTLMMQFADNGSTYIVANNSLQRRKNEKDLIYRKQPVLKFADTCD